MEREEFERAAPESVGLPSRAALDLLDRLAGEGAEMHGLMIMRRGKVCAEGWWAPYGPGIRHGCQSLTKTYAATGVGLAYTEGLVGLDERVIDIFAAEAPRKPSENLARLRVRDVLCMGCGMDEMPLPSADWIRAFLAVPVLREPGTAFMYNSMGSTLLGAIVKRKTGMGLHDWLSERLFGKIGIDAGNLRWVRLPDGTEVGGGGLYSTTEDNLRLMRLYAQGGTWKGERILAEDYVRLATTKRIDTASERAVNPPAKDNFLGYGFQIWMCEPDGAYRADGAMGQFSIVFPRQDLIVAVNETAKDGWWAQRSLDAIYGSLLPPLAEGALPRDDEAAGLLAERLSHLAIARPAYAPRSPTAARISGKRYEPTGEVPLELRLGSFMSPTAAAPRITSFSFDFSGGLCVLDVEEDGRPLRLSVGLDGTRRLNVLPVSGSPETMLYLSGSWPAPDRFELAARWVETCFEKRLSFAFSEGSALVSAAVAVGFSFPGSGRSEPVAAIERPERGSH
jgi:CubicO group peptidase (beta-lactamase class C family)